MTKEELKRANEISKRIEDLESKMNEIRLENERVKQGVESASVKLVGGGYICIDDVHSFAKTLIEMNCNKIDAYNKELKKLRKEFSEL